MADPLLDPFQLKHLKLRNRIFSSAHEPAYGEDGLPKDRYRLYHEEKAKGGVALTMTAGSAVVAEDSPAAFGNLHAYKDEIVPWIQRLTDGVHEHGAACMVQLSHMGRRTTYAQGDWLPLLAASPLREPAHRSHPKEAEDWDIERLIGKYVDAAERMQAGGMDGIELQSYGHLMDGFWSTATNQRDDEWGGTESNLRRFPLMVMRAIRERVGADFIVGIRMTFDEIWQPGIDAADGLSKLAQLETEGLVDFVNVIRGTTFTDSLLTGVIPIQGMSSAPHLDFAGAIRAETNLPVLHAAKIDDLATARHSIAEGKLDLVGMTRAQIADPYLVEKLEQGRETEIRPCVGATYCLDRIYEAGEALCVHNAATGREGSVTHIVTSSESAKRVVVIGGGPAGLEAARVSAERGHTVTLLEAMPKVGGQLNLATRNPRRVDLVGIVDWRLGELERMGVDVQCDVFAQANDVVDLEPDVVFIATGGQPQLPPLESGEDLVATSWEVMDGSVRPSGQVLFYDDDGTHSAMSAAEVLALTGVDLEIVTPERTLGVDIGGMNYVPYARAFNENETRITLNTRLLAVRRGESGLVATLGSDQTSYRFDRQVDAVIVDHGALPLTDLYFDLKAGSSNGGAVDHGALIAGEAQSIVRNESGTYQLYRIGDAVSNRNIHAAIYDALRLAIHI